MAERSLLFVMKPASWISAESRYWNTFSSHPWTLIVQRLAVCFDVPERIERAPVFPHNWMIFAFILSVEEKEAWQWCYMRQYKMNSSHVRGNCKYRWNAHLHIHTCTVHAEYCIFPVNNLFCFLKGTKDRWLPVHYGPYTFMNTTQSLAQNKGCRLGSLDLNSGGPFRCRSHSHSEVPVETFSALRSPCS